MDRMELVAGIFVGGRARRMGGRAKGLLVAPSGETIAAGLVRKLEARGATCVLVGAASGYEALALPSLADDPAAEGPLAGVLALLAHAGERCVVSVACDMPYVSDVLLARLLAAPAAPIVAPRRDGRWEPFFARWEAARVLPIARRLAARGTRSLQALFEEAGAVALPIDAEDAQSLRDWDSPDDMRGD